MRSKEFVAEAVMSVGIQAKHPISAGARSLMGSRWRYDQAVATNVKQTLTNAVDQLEHNLKYIPELDHDHVHAMLHHVCETFRIMPNELHGAFVKKFNCSPARYAVNYKKSREGQPVKI